MKVSPVGTNWKTSENQSINHAKFVCQGVIWLDNSIIINCILLFFVTVFLHW